MQEIYLLTLVLALACGLAMFIKRLGLPLLVSYIGVGAILSAFHIIKPEQLEFLAILPEIGLALLLFLVGMELDLSSFKSIGKKVFLATGIQVTVTTILLYFGLTMFAGMTSAAAFILAISISFTSTILVIKLLVEEKDLTTLHGKLSVGILLVEDLLAVLLLMVMTVVWGGSGSLMPTEIILVILKGVLLILISLLIGKKVLPFILRLTADSTELLFLTAFTWCLVFVSFASFLGFSLAIGAFLAGVSLAQSVYRLQITGKIKPLRDFFIMIFFLDLGTGLSISGLGEYLWLGVFFLFYAVIIKPAIFFVSFTFFKFRAHPSFLTSVYISTISEFSLIVLVSASKLGIIDKEYLSPLIFATVLSFVFSSILITNQKGLWARFGKYLRKAEISGAKGMKDEYGGNLKDHAVLIGCHRSGEIVLEKLEKIYEKNLVVLDFNPDVVADLNERSIRCIYGDVTDPELLENLGLSEAKVVVSTVRNIRDNLVLLDEILKEKSKAVVIITAEDVKSALVLYEKGAHYVSLPMSLEGHNISKMLEVDLKIDKEKRMEELAGEVSR